VAQVCFASASASFATPLRVAPDACDRPIDETFVIDDAPFAWPATGWLSKVGSLAVDRGADLILTGTGGDELFGLGLDTKDKGAFGSALDRSFRAARGRVAVRDLLSMRELARTKLVRADAFRRTFEAFMSDTAARSNGAGWVELWPPLALEAFLRRARQK